MAETGAVAATPETPAVGPDAPADGADKGTPVAVDPLSPKPGEKTYKVKIGGKEEIWSERKVLERAQKSEGAEVAMKRAAQIEQAFENFVSQAQDPAKLLQLLSNPKALGYDDSKQEALLNAMLGSKNPRIVNTAKKWLWENEVEPAGLSDDERKMRELEKFKTTREAEDAQRKLEQEASEKKAEGEKYWNEYRLKIGQGIKAEGLPENESLVVRIARKAQMMRRAGQPADIPAAVKMVKEEWRQEFIHLMTGMTEDQILAMYPEETLKTINKAFLKRLKGAELEEPKIEGSERPHTPKSKEKAKENKNFWRDIGRGNVQI